MRAISKQRVLNCPNLPTVPAVALRVLEMTRDPNVSLPDLAKLVQGDAGLSTKLLRTVNSSFYALQERCGRVDRAMGLLGLKAVKSLVLGFSLVDVTKAVDADEGFDLTSHWRRALFGAAGARRVAMLTKACEPDEAFTASLLQDIGMLAIFAAMPTEYGVILSTAPESHGELCPSEREAMGFDHAEIGAELSERWNLPEPFTQCVRYHHAGDDCRGAGIGLVRAVALGAMLADALSVTDPGKHMPTLLSCVSRWFGDQLGDLDKLLQATSMGGAELAQAFETDVGEVGDVRVVMAQAQEAMLQAQLEMTREAEELRKTNDDLSRQTFTDQLTGAANRRRFDRLAAETFAAARRAATPLSALFFDADKFKAVNDTHGHAAGDAVLIELSRRLAAALGTTGEVCRVGGEEFAAVLPGADGPCGLEVAERCRKQVCATPFNLVDQRGTALSLELTVSVGVATMDRAAPFESIEKLVQAADQAVYSAKQAGRNCVRSAAGPAPRAAGAAPVDATHVVIVEEDPLAAKLLVILFQRRKQVSVRCLNADRATAQHLRSAVDSARGARTLIVCTAHAAAPILAEAESLSTRSAGAVTVAIIGRKVPPAERDRMAKLGFVVSTKADMCRDLTGWVDRMLARERKEAA